MFLICLFLWILFNGALTLEILLFGIVISAFIYTVSCAFFGFSFEKDLAFFKKIPGILSLFRVLLVQIVKENLEVTGMIWSGRTLQPSYQTFQTPLRSTAARVILADCITLTPGTITGLLDGDRYTIHCLSRSMADGLEQEHYLFACELLKIEGNGDVAK